MTNVLSRHGYDLLLQGAPFQRFEDAIFFQSDQTDGICVFLSGKAPRQRAMLEQLLTLGQPVMAFEETDDRSFPGTCIVRQDNAGGSQAFGAARHGRQGSVDGADIVTGQPEQPCRRRAQLIEEGADLSLLRPALADTGTAVFAHHSHEGGLALVPASSWVSGRTVQDAVELEGLDSDDTQGRFLDVGLS